MPLDFLEREFLAGEIVSLVVRGDSDWRLGVFERAAVLQISRNSGGPKVWQQVE